MAILRSWRTPRPVLRDLLAQDRREGRLMLYLTLGLGLIFIAQWPRLARQSTEAVNLEAHLAGALFGIMFIGPLLFYGLAFVLALPLRLAFGAEGFAVRLSVFWALLATTPALLAQAALTGLVGQGAVGSVVESVSGFIVLALFLFILVGGLRVALEAAPRSA